MIPQGWQSIGEPDVPELSPDAKAVQAYIDTRVPRKITYKSMVEICRALRMGFERVQDAIYEIRKQEAIMARKPKINKEQRAEMLVSTMRSAIPSGSSQANTDARRLRSKQRCKQQKSKRRTKL